MIGSNAVWCVCVGWHIPERRLCHAGGVFELPRSKASRQGGWNRPPRGDGGGKRGSDPSCFSLLLFCTLFSTRLEGFFFKYSLILVLACVCLRAWSLYTRRALGTFRLFKADAAIRRSHVGQRRGRVIPHHTIRSYRIIHAVTFIPHNSFAVFSLIRSNCKGLS